MGFLVATSHQMSAKYSDFMFMYFIVAFSIQKLELHIPESALYQHAAQLQQHVAMLQTMTLNLSSKAEGLGQVLQV